MEILSSFFTTLLTITLSFFGISENPSAYVPTTKVRHETTIATTSTPISPIIEIAPNPAITKNEIGAIPTKEFSTTTVTGKENAKIKNLTYKLPDGKTFSYPSNFEPQKTENGVYLGLIVDPSVTIPELPGLSVEIYNNPKNLSILEYFDGDPGEDLKEFSGNEFEKKIIEGKEVLFFHEVVGLTGAGVAAVIPYNKELIEVFDNMGDFQNNGWFDKIIAELSRQ